MRLTVLGSASGISMPGRGHAAVALEAGGALYLFDLGEPVGRTLFELGLPIERLRAAFVSHMHSDHSSGLVQFVKNLHLYHNHPDYLPQVDRVTLALPAEAIEPVRAFMAACYMFPERLNLAIDYFPLRNGTVWDDGIVSVAARQTGHLEHYREFVESRKEYRFLECQAFSFEASFNDRRIVYSGDLAGIEDIIAVAEGADMLVLESGHLFPLEENLQKLASLDIGRVILTHIFPDYNDRECELAEIAERALPDKVIIARDGLAVEI